MPQKQFGPGIAVTEAYLAGTLLPAMQRAVNGSAEEFLSADERAVLAIVKRYHYDLEQRIPGSGAAA